MLLLTEHDMVSLFTLRTDFQLFKAYIRHSIPENLLNFHFL